MADKAKKEVGGKPTKKKRANRSEELSVPTGFVNGYTDGWFMAVPHRFHSALDVELTTIMRKRQKPEKSIEELAWTEGRPPIYNFKSGDTIYNDRKAYEQEWSKSLAKTSVVLQVAEALPDQLNGSAKTPGSLLVLVYRSKRDCSGLELAAKHRMTQDEFVNVLKAGLLPNGASL